MHTLEIRPGELRALGGLAVSSGATCSLSLHCSRPMQLRAILNSGGGLRYHLRALRFGRHQWQPFRWAIGEWLLGWQPPQTTLLLIGPSAGYCLQSFFFERFERLVCLEPDPVAQFLFKRRLSAAPLERHPKLEFIAEDCLVHHPERLQHLLETNSDMCLLFSNVIGQLRGLLNVENNDSPEFSRIRSAVRQAIAGRSWASFHDRVSGTLHPGFDEPVLANSRLADQEVVELLYSAAPLSRKRNERKLIDHLTEGFFPAELPYAYFSWEIEPGRFHVIEAVSSVSDP
jgi:hypothetical protein